MEKQGEAKKEEEQWRVRRRGRKELEDMRKHLAFLMDVFCFALPSNSLLT